MVDEEDRGKKSNRVRVVEVILSLLISKIFHLFQTDIPNECFRLVGYLRNGKCRHSMNRK